MEIVSQYDENYVNTGLISLLQEQLVKQKKLDQSINHYLQKESILRKQLKIESLHEKRCEINHEFQYLTQKIKDIEIQQSVDLDFIRKLKQKSKISNIIEKMDTKLSSYESRKESAELFQQHYTYLFSNNLIVRDLYQHAHRYVCSFSIKFFAKSIELIKDFIIFLQDIYQQLNDIENGIDKCLNLDIFNDILEFDLNYHNFRELESTEKTYKILQTKMKLVIGFHEKVSLMHYK